MLRLKLLIIFFTIFTAWSGIAEAAPHGTVLDFDGDDYLVASDNAVFDQNDRLSISVWVKPDAGSDDYILYRANAYYLKITSTCAIEGAIYYSSTFTGHTVESSAITCDGSAWTHIEMTYDKDDGELKLYIDSVLKDTESHTTAISDTNTPLYIASDSTPANYFDGKIDDVRLYQYARSASDVRLDYNEGLASHFGPREKTCSEDPASCMDYGLVGYWNFDEGTGQMAYDNSDNNNDGTLGADSFVGTDDPKWAEGSPSVASGGGGLSFDGVDDYVDCGSDASLDITGAITIEAWVKWNGGGDSTIISKITDGSYKDYVIYIGTDNKLHIWYESGTGDVYIDSNQDISTGQWIHIAIAFDTLHSGNMYINGQFEKSWDSTENRDTSSQPVYIGGLVTYYDVWYFNGTIDEVRIYNRALSAEEIRYHYNRGGAVAHWKFDEGSGTTAYDETSNNNDGTLTNMDDDDWVEGKYGGALEFDGTDDVVSVTQASSINLTNKKGYTISAWIYPHSDGEADAGEIIDKGANTFLRVDSEDAGLLDVEASLDLATDDATLNITDAISINTWSHIVLTYEDDDDDEITIYINGTNKGTSADGDGAPATDTNNLLIGGDAAVNFDGLIDDVRIYNYARTAEQILQDYNAGLAGHFR